MFCESCGKEISVDAQFCQACGISTQTPPPNAGHAAPITRLEAPVSTGVADHAKLATRDTMEALKVLAVDPTGSIVPVYERLNPQRAIGVGLGLAILFDICILFSVQRLLSSASGIPFLGQAVYYGAQIPWFKLFLLGLVPFACIFAALAAAHRVFRGTGGLHGDVLVAGLTLLPLGLATVASSLIGIGNVEVICVIFLFALTYTILILYTGCARVANIRESGAALAVPLILLASAWLIKIAYTSLLTSDFMH